MQDKKLKYFIISFTPIFLLNELGYRSDRFGCLFDYLSQTGRLNEMEEAGERFLRCANINPMVKILAGFLSSEANMFSAGNAGLKYIYSSRFASRDILACLEHFNVRPEDETFIKIDYDFDPERGSDKLSGEKSEFAESGKEAISVADGDFSFGGFDFLLTKYKGLHGSEPKDGEKIVIISGTAPPLFGDLFDYLAGCGVRAVYCEYIDILLRSACKYEFSPEAVLNMNFRIKKINRIAAGLREKYGRQNIGIIHTFPKFSHYDIEDHFFGRNTAGKFLSLEYAGGGALGERDRLRLEAFFKIID